MSETPENPNTVIVRRLTKIYGGIKVVDNVSFRIGKGEILGFLGPNGAGKSTTMKILSGMCPATSGSAYVCGVSVANNPGEVRRHIGYMPENNPLPEDLRVSEYLRYRAGLKEVPVRETSRRVEEAMEICQLNRKAKRKIIGNLSKGFRQRVGIADAILSKPDLIIMDEPTIGLDPHQIIAIRSLINSLRGKMSVIISSHILPEIELVCDRVIIINQGRIVASGSSESLRKEFISSDKYGVGVKCPPEEFGKYCSVMGNGLRISSHSKSADADGYWDYVLESDIGSDLGRSLIGELSKDTRLAVREVSRLKPNLEEIFMAATRRSWEEVRGVKDKGADLEVDDLRKRRDVRFAPSSDDASSTEEGGK